MDNLKKLAGRLVLGRLPGLSLDDEHRRALEQGTLGGITLFKENAADINQLAKLCTDILSASEHPPVLTVDQEGGAVQRFEHVISPLPSPMALAAHGSLEMLRKITAISAGQLKALGFNLLLAPTLDLLNNPINPVICTRAFANNVQTVSRLGEIVIDEIQKQGLVACSKHFPGHGCTDQDSHLELAVVPKSKAELEAYDLAPFKATIKAVKSVLIGHIWLPKLITRELPASLSSLIVTDMLRGELGFDGLIVSDDMTMKAITRAYGLGEACVMALEAGIDLLLVCGSNAESQQAVEAIAAAAASGRLSEHRLHESIARLDLLFGQRPVPRPLHEIIDRVAMDNRLSTACSAEAVAVLAGKIPEEFKSRRLPENLLIVVPNHPRYPLNLSRQLAEIISRPVAEKRYSLNCDDTEIANILASIEADRPVLLLTFRAYINRGQEALAAALMAGRPFMHIACDTPYDSDLVLSRAASGQSKPLFSLASFDPSEQAMAGLASILTGQARPCGKNPLT